MAENSKTITWIVIPVFNDYVALEQLLTNIDKLRLECRFKVVIIDDASYNQIPEMDSYKKFLDEGSIVEIYLLNLPSNQGNQGAIAQGLKLAFGEANNSDMFIVMDSDGEDSPSSIPTLLQAMDSNSIVVAKRTKQKTNPMISSWHIIFKTIFRLLIGKPINFGNFSLLKYEQCRQIVSNRKLETSYIGTLLLSGIDIKRIPIKRGIRYEGKSRTSRDGLFTAGFQILTVFLDRIFVRLLRIVAICILILGLGIFTILFLKLFTARVISGWAGVMIAIFSTSLVQLIVLLAGLMMIQINAKSEKKHHEDSVSVLKISETGN